MRPGDNLHPYETLPSGELQFAPPCMCKLMYGVMELLLLLLFGKGTHYMRLR